MPQGAFCRELFRRFTPVWLIVLAVVSVLTAVFMAAVDIRISLVAMMVVLLVVPFVEAMLYYSYALSRENFINGLPHSVRIDNDRLVVTLWRRPTEDEQEEYVAEGEEKKYIRLRDESFDPAHITGWTPGSQGGTASLSDRRRGFLYIPASIYADDAAYREVAAWMREKALLSNSVTQKERKL